jgi:tripartite-type tricarboxylate transporter receptor subunit TctC
MIGRALVWGLALAGAPGLVQAQSAQNWPLHTVRMITPLGPGSGMDVAARLFAERLSQKWGQPVVVENRQGADGILAVQSFLSDRDNHSLIFGFAGLHSINPILHGDKLPLRRPRRGAGGECDRFDPGAHGVGGREGQHPGRVRRAGESATRQAELGGDHRPSAVCGGGLAEGRRHRHYADFLSRLQPGVQDFATGRVQLLATGITLLLPQVQAGPGKFLMVTNSARSPLGFRGADTAEAGFPSSAFNGVNGIYGWRDMPESLKARIAADVRDIATDPAVAARLQPPARPCGRATPREFAAAIEEQRAKVAAVAQAAGVERSRRSHSGWKFAAFKSLALRSMSSAMNFAKDCGVSATARCRARRDGPRRRGPSPRR